MPARAIEVLRDIHVRDESNAKPVIEGDLLVIDAIALGEGLVPSQVRLRESCAVRD
jgi:hypothetical protein